VGVRYAMMNRARWKRSVMQFVRGCAVRYDESSEVEEECDAVCSCITGV